MKQYQDNQSLALPRSASPAARLVISTVILEPTHCHVFTKSMSTRPPLLTKFMSRCRVPTYSQSSCPHVLLSSQSSRPHKVNVCTSSCPCTSRPPSRHQCQVPPRLVDDNRSLLQRLLAKHPVKVNAKSRQSETVSWY